MRRKKILLPILLTAIVVGVFFVTNQKSAAPSNSTGQTNSKQRNASFNKAQYSINQQGSIWWIVNKKRALPSGYTPSNLTNPKVALRLSSSTPEMNIRGDVAPAVEQLFAGAANAGHKLLFASGYRSEALQKQLYDGYVRTDGQEAADRSSAKPGTSEHQTGLAFDICLANSGCSLEQSFGTTPAGQWIADHAHEYGFVVRYQQGKEQITGYEYEPWHLRYVGTELATELHSNGLTMEEFFGL